MLGLRIWRSDSRPTTTFYFNSFPCGSGGLFFSVSFLPAFFSTLCSILQPKTSCSGANEIKLNPPIVPGVLVNKYVSYVNNPLVSFLPFIISASALIQFTSSTFKDIVVFNSFNMNMVLNHLTINEPFTRGFRRQELV